MATTRLKRKDRKNKARANNRISRIKQLLVVPVIKNVDPEGLKAQFGNSGNTSSASDSKKESGEAPAKEKKAPKAKTEEANAIAEAHVEEHQKGEAKAAEGDNAIEPENAIGSEDKGE